MRHHFKVYCLESKKYNIFIYKLFDVKVGVYNIWSAVIQIPVLSLKIPHRDNTVNMAFVVHADSSSEGIQLIHHEA